MSVSFSHSPPQRRREFAEPMPRCCPRHEDWVVLGRHLCADFPSVPAAEILRLLTDAQQVTERFALDPTDALEIGELICRHQLMLLTGQIADAAHLDPQIHRPREASESGLDVTRVDLPD